MDGWEEAGRDETRPQRGVPRRSPVTVRPPGLLSWTLCTGVEMAWTQPKVSTRPGYRIARVDQSRCERGCKDAAFLAACHAHVAFAAPGLW